MTSSFFLGCVGRVVILVRGDTHEKSHRHEKEITIGITNKHNRRREKNNRRQQKRKYARKDGFRKEGRIKERRKEGEGRGRKGKEGETLF